MAGICGDSPYSSLHTMSDPRPAACAPAPKDSSTEEEWPLMISSDYVRDWGMWEGVRELVQNWYDGVLGSFKTEGRDRVGQAKLVLEKEVLGGCVTYSAGARSGMLPLSSFMRQFLKGNGHLELSQLEEHVIKEVEKEEPSGHLGTLIYDRTSQVLTLINFNTSVPASCLLVGASSKSLHHQSIGQFGEGLKLGALALVRCGSQVVMETGNQIWKFAVKQHPNFSSQVLTIIASDRDSGRRLQPLPPHVSAQERDVCAQISSIPEDKWLEFAQKFLFLEKAKDSVDMDCGSLLLDQEHAGDLYVKQIWIKNMEAERLKKGVDIKGLALDRDRKCAANHSEVEHEVSQIWSQAVKRRPELASMYYPLLADRKSSSCDAKHAQYYIDDSDSIDHIASEFFKEHGSDAYPVLDSTAHDTLHRLEKEFKKRVVYVNQSLHSILHRSCKLAAVEEVLGSPSSAELQRLSGLRPSQEASLHHGLALVQLLEGDFPSEKVDLTTSTDTEVVFSATTGHYQVPSWMLEPQQVHHRLLLGSGCPSQVKECLCPAACFALRILHSTRAPNPLMQLFYFLSHLLPQIDRSCPPYCLPLHQHPALTAAERTSLGSELAHKEAELHERRAEFEQALSVQVNEEKQILEELEKKLEKARMHALDADMHHFRMADVSREQARREQEKYQEAIELLVDECKKHLQKLSEAKNELCRQQDHLKCKGETLEQQRQQRKQQHVRDAEVQESRIRWLKDILDSRRKCMQDLRQASEHTTLEEKFEGLWSSVETLSTKLDTCITCCQQRPQVYYRPCRHFVVCESCTPKLEPKDSCPLCRQFIDETQLTVRRTCV